MGLCSQMIAAVRKVTFQRDGKASDSTVRPTYLWYDKGSSYLLEVSISIHVFLKKDKTLDVLWMILWSPLSGEIVVPVLILYLLPRLSAQVCIQKRKKG